MTINPDGKVGIGGGPLTSNPAEQLSVDGSIHSNGRLNLVGPNIQSKHVSNTNSEAYGITIANTNHLNNKGTGSNGSAELLLSNKISTWNVNNRADGNFAIHSNDRNIAALTISEANGNVTIKKNLHVEGKITSKSLNIGQSSFGAKGKLQVTGGIGLTGDSEIRQSTDSDGSSLRFLGTQFIAGHLNSTSYNYNGSGLIASLSPMASEIMLDVGAVDAVGHRLKVINDSSGIQGSLEYKSGGNVIFKADSSSGELLIGNNIALGQENATGIRRGNLGELVLGAKSGGLFHQVKDEKDAQGKIIKKYYKINTAAGYTSDARLKENIVPIDSALDKVMQMEGVYYNFIEEQKSASLNGQQIGVIAQNIEAVFPEAVVEQDNIKHVRYDILIAPLIEAIKELKLQNEALSARVLELEESRP